MAKTSYYVDKADPASVEELIDAFEARGTEFEDAIRQALMIHGKSFILMIDRLSQLQISPLHDQFSFDMNTDSLILFTDSPASLVDGILEMAMFLRGFNTLIGVNEEWKLQVAIGSWRHVRESLKTKMKLPFDTEKTWGAALDLETVEKFNMMSFGTMLMLAGRPDVDVIFPDGTSALVLTTYQRLARIMEAVAFDIGLDDHTKFNRRLNRAVGLIEESILPADDSPFDDLFGPDGFSDKFFSDEIM